jgi:hypothetical protein
MTRLDRAIHERYKGFGILEDGRFKRGHDNRSGNDIIIRSNTAGGICHGLQQRK